MSPNPFFSGRISQDLFDAIEAHRSKTGESKTEVLINALSAYLNHPIKSVSTEDRLNLLEDRIAVLEERLVSSKRKSRVHQLPLNIS